MSLDRVRAHLDGFGLGDRIIETDASSATVELAAQAVGTEPARIAKSLSFLVDGAPVIVVAAGDAVVDNRAFREAFAAKARMIPAGEVERHIGYGVGGVCPFGVSDGVRVHLDESLRRFDEVFPAAGTPNSAVRLTIAELEEASGSAGWVRVCRLREG